MEGYAVNLLYRGRKLNIQLHMKKTRVELVSGDAVFLKLNEKEIHLEAGKGSIYEEEI